MSESTGGSDDGSGGLRSDRGASDRMRTMAGMGTSGDFGGQMPLLKLHGTAAPEMTPASVYAEASRLLDALADTTSDEEIRRELLESSRLYRLRALRAEPAPGLREAG